MLGIEPAHICSEACGPTHQHRSHLQFPGRWRVRSTESYALGDVGEACAQSDVFLASHEHDVGCRAPRSVTTLFLRHDNVPSALVTGDARDDIGEPFAVVLHRGEPRWFPNPVFSWHPSIVAACPDSSIRATMILCYRP